jgi:hypothetical protein
MAFLKITRRFVKDGVALVGYSCHVSVSGGNVPARLYNDAAGTARYPTNVLVTDAEGKVSAFVDAGKSYRMVLRAPGIVGHIDFADPVLPAEVGVESAEVVAAAEITEVAYAATITPVCNKEHTIINVAALTGPMTIAAPTGMTKGSKLTFMFLQDATGGRVITWNAAFSKAADGAGTANQIAATGDVYNGTKWIQMGGALTYRA